MPPPLPPSRLERVRKDAKREKPAPTIDIGRHYAALFAEKTNPLNATKGLVDGDGTHGNENRGTNDADAPSAAAAATATGLSPGSRAGGFAHRRRFNNNRRRRRTRGKNRDGNIETSVKKGVGPSSFGAGNRGSWGNVVMHNYLEKKHPHEEVQRVDNKGKKEESAGYLSTRGVVVKGVAQGEPRMMMKAEQESNNKSGRITTDGGEAVWGNRRESEREQAQPGWSKVEDNECMGKEEAWQQQEHPPDDRVQSYSSDYSEESFELTVESEERRLAVGIEETKSLVSHGGAGNISGGNTERREESASSGHAATVEETLSEENTAAAAVAAALRIESCWRGFLGRCAAKCALRSVLLGALRNIGGGKISKVTDTPLMEENPIHPKYYCTCFTPHMHPLCQSARSMYRAVCGVGTCLIVHKSFMPRALFTVCFSFPVPPWNPVEIKGADAGRHRTRR